MKWSDRLGLLLHPTGACFVFFSSRRRHTRLQGDWSSDVCSSDLCPATSTTSSRRPVRSKTCWASRLAPSASPRGGTARARRGRPPARFQNRDRKSVGEGKRVDLGGGRIIKKKKKKRDRMKSISETA